MKIPPLIIFALPILLGGLAAHFGYVGGSIIPGQQILAIILMIVGLCFIGFAVFGFRLNQTTVDPIHPDGASALVTDGIYAISRNPMYVGMAACSLAITIFFGWYVGVAAIVLAILYINQFQIKPEETVLTSIFGDDYIAYCRNVRRWL